MEWNGMLRKVVGSSVVLLTGVVVMAPAVVVAAPSAPSPSLSVRSASQCAFSSPENGYVVPDIAANTLCVVNKNGTWLFLKPAVIKKNQKVKVVAQIKKPMVRGDVRTYARVTFLRGNKVIVKRVAINSKGRVGTKQRLTKKGKWAVVVTYRGQAISALVQVK
jgi:hypothetical protein